MSTMKVDSIVSSGGTNTAQINGITPALASQATAEAGTNNTDLMTALRTEQAISKLAMEYLGEIVTTSGTTQTLSGLTLTDYKWMYAFFKGVSHNNGSAAVMNFAGGQVTNSINSHPFRGLIIIDLSDGYVAWAGQMAIAGDGGFIGNVNNSSTSVSVSMAAGSFDAGSIKIYGVR
jgi:hypothetical protein